MIQEKKYTKEQMLQMLYNYLKVAGQNQTKAIQAFREANEVVKQKLEKNGIKLSEFVDYSNSQG